MFIALDEIPPLVTIFGGAGYIGSVLTRQLLAEGYRVRIFDNFMFGDDGISDIDSPLLEVYEGDMTNVHAVSNAIEGSETVILLTAVIGHRFSNLDRSDIRSINLLASSVVLDACLEHAVSRFIFASGNSVYGKQSGIIYETAIPEPASLAARLKLRMEERIMRARNRFFHPTSMRIGTCYGYSPRMRFDLVGNAFVRDAIYKKEMTVYGGDQTRALVHVDDVARGFVLCLKAHVNLVSGQVFNLGAKDQIFQIHALANVVKSIIPDSKINILPAEADLIDYRLNYSRIEKILDFVPRWTVEDGIKQIKDLLLNNQFSDPYSFKYFSH